MAGGGTILRTALRLFLALILTVLAVVLAHATLVLASVLNTRQTVLPVAAGFGAALIVFLFFQPLTALYVAGHELTHWLTAKLFLRRTGRLRLRGTHGSVDIEHPNIWIMLAPYFVPIYALGWIGINGLLQFSSLAAVPVLQRIFLVGLGVTYAFHVALTAHALRRGQTDLHAHGAVLSLAVIGLCNVFLLFAAVVVAGRHWESCLGQIMQSLEWLFRGWRLVLGRLQSR